MKTSNSKIIVAFAMFVVAITLLMVVGFQLMGSQAPENSDAKLLEGVDMVDGIVVQEFPDGVKLLSTICRPKNQSGKVPAIVLIHGGSFMDGDRSRVSEQCQLVAQAGMVGISLEYRLIQETFFPAMVQDVQYGVRWVRHHADEYGIDAAKIGAYGRSAGGMLAAMLGVRSTMKNDLGLDEYSSRVSAVYVEFGPMDFVNVDNIPDEEGGGFIGSFGPEFFAQVSPITFVTSGDAPFYISHGTKDLKVPYQNALNMQSKLQSAGVEVTLYTFKGGHGYSEAAADEAIAWEGAMAMMKSKLPSANILEVEDEDPTDGGKGTTNGGGGGGGTQEGGECLPLDKDSNGLISLIDLSSFALNYGKSCTSPVNVVGPCTSQDVDRDGKIGLKDLSELALIYEVAGSCTQAIGDPPRNDD